MQHLLWRNDKIALCRLVDLALLHELRQTIVTHFRSGSLHVRKSCRQLHSNVLDCS